MTKFTKIALTIALTTGMAAAVQAQISYTGGTYTQDFDSMGSTGTTTPIGWFVGTGTGAAVVGTTVIAGTGSGTAGGNYNFGVAGVNVVGERALGSLASSSTQRDTEVHFTNNMGFDITQFTIGYDGEQWRNGDLTTVAANTLTLQLSTDGLTWTSLGSAFNFASPINSGGPSGALDGNASANRIAGIGGTFNLSTSILAGSTFFLRWADADDSGIDDGIAIDNFTFSAVPEPSVYMLLGVGILLCGQRFMRRSKSA
jgi:hypothetical protein